MIWTSTIIDTKNLCRAVGGKYKVRGINRFNKRLFFI